MQLYVLPNSIPFNTKNHLYASTNYFLNRHFFEEKKIEIRHEKCTPRNTQEWMFLVYINKQSVLLFRLKNVYCNDFIES